jgi:anti-sigma regulatory factor (Ser/Thr protein kinase)
MRFSANFPAVSESVFGARQFVTNSVANVPREVLDTIVVIASELATNCVRYGSSSFEIRIDQLDDRILIEAEDRGEGQPIVRSPGPEETSGRGLQIVKGLANSWGVERSSQSAGKTVWAIVAIPPNRQDSATSEMNAPYPSRRQSII